ncbi:uncharacterized protein DUF4376 [Pseudomonas sp. SJZ085]|uniref:DUF4376 domain-containing protein n=1 Tax=unclassified Pseudomonas TaxID=196821 RepID=UPI001198D022|nr:MULTISPECIES: DUF4376 domain-containing protein [unclassified Pseudomonas]TWC18656.1 uncharacterized protein DUF4376 [Pseudomonas sp. SJZ074]TWC36439.1 uncharacterized protein DUF4376 [Pseudomonas sp. SJZ085]
MVMSMWARIENATVAEVTDIDPQDRFPPSLIWTTCPGDTLPGMQYVEGRFTINPTAPIDHAVKIAAVRYQHEIAGITVNGIRIDTHRDSQALITAAALSAVLDPTYACVWKALSGPVKLTAAQLIDIATAVRTHVQASFDRECQLLTALAEGTYTVDMLEHGWPSAQGA